MSQPEEDAAAEPRKRVDADRETAEVIESAGMQNAVVVTGPGALVMVPVAWALAAVKKALQRR